MSLNDKRCPTCDATNFIQWGDGRVPCPTCSPSSHQTEPYVLADDQEEDSTSRAWRLKIVFLAAVALVAIFALLAKGLQLLRQ